MLLGCVQLLGVRDNPEITTLTPGGLFVGPGVIEADTRNFKDAELLLSADTWGVNRSPHQGWGGACFRDLGLGGGQSRAC